MLSQSCRYLRLRDDILIINKQSNYLQSLPIGYNLQNVVSFPTNKAIASGYNILVQELTAYPEVSKVSGSNHRIGGGFSGQGVSLLENSNKNYPINEYRVLSKLCDLMEFQLKEGNFFGKEIPDSIPQIIINEAAVRMLNLKEPVAGQYIGYKAKGGTMIVGVVKDFIYEIPSIQVAPLLFSVVRYPSHVYIKFNEGVSKVRAREIITETLKKIDPQYIINPSWEEDFYQQKFDTIQAQSKVVSLGSLLSILIASLGLVAIHLYTTIRRKKEIAIRRVNGSTSKELFFLLTKDVLKWVLVAAVVAVPIAYYACTEWLSNHAVRTNLNWMIFVIPIALQCLIAIIATAGISVKVLMENPIKSLKNE